MKIFFHIRLEESDFIDLGGDSVVDSLWTHQTAIDWLDQQGYDCHVYKDLITSEIESDYIDLKLTYSLKPEEMTQFLLKYPMVTKTFPPYEQVSIIND
jgi:hypothetical protein